MKTLSAIFTGVVGFVRRHPFLCIALVVVLWIGSNETTRRIWRFFDALAGKLGSFLSSDETRQYTVGNWLLWALLLLVAMWTPGIAALLAIAKLTTTAKVRSEAQKPLNADLSTDNLDAAQQQRIEEIEEKLTELEADA